MDRQHKGFNKWLDKTLGPFDRFIMKGYSFCIYEIDGKDRYSVELTMFDKYDENDDSWNCGGREYYASRFDNNEYYFNISGGWKICLDTVGYWISCYLQKGKYRKIMKTSEIVGYSFASGDTQIAYKKNMTE